MANQKKKQLQINHDSVLEQLHDVGASVVKSTQSDLVGGVASGILTDLFAPTKKDLKPGEEIVISSQEKALKQPIKEFRQPEVILFTAEEANLAREVEIVRAELQRTVKELKELNTTVVEVEKTIALTPVKAGKYHFSFFAKLRAVLRLFRQQVSESRVWLEAFFAKRKKRGYWSMFKKHGTTFGLSSERVIATQAG